MSADSSCCDGKDDGLFRLWLAQLGTILFTMKLEEGRKVNFGSLCNTTSAVLLNSYYLLQLELITKISWEQ